MNKNRRTTRMRACAGAVAMLVVAAFGATANAQVPAPSIQLLSPSGHSALMSDKGGPFHLTAWGANVPQTAVVEFEIQAAGRPAVTIGTAQRAGADTFELSWDISTAFENGTYTLRALLYSGESGNFREVARDTQTVQLAHRSDPTSPAAESIEIAYPGNGTLAGFFTPSNGQPHVIIDVVGSAGTTRARTYYTITAPGEEPQWKICGTETAAQAANGIRCVLASGDAVSAVTAVAAVANTTPVAPGVELNPTLNASGDAHRVVGYSQTPSGLALTPETHRVDAAAGVFPCSQSLTATVTDQMGRKIAGANVDVYAKGPTDQLAFDTSNQSALNQPPDQRSLTNEPAFNCSTGSFGGFQADDNRVSDADRKHIESAAGTNDAGQVDFKLHSDSSGVTYVTAWADTDGNDFFCATEPNDSATISWGQDMAAPSPEPADTEGCTTTSPSPSITATPTATATSTEPPAPASVDVSLEASRSRAIWGSSYEMAGRVTATPATAGCTGLVTVTISRDVTGGTVSYTDVGSTVTDADGFFTMTRTADQSATYVARTTGSEVCEAGSSSGTTVLVSKKVRITVERSASGPDTITAKVFPCSDHAGERIVLQRRHDGRFDTVARRNSNGRCAARFEVDRPGIYRAVSPKSDADHLAGSSSRVRI